MFIVLSCNGNQWQSKDLRNPNFRTPLSNVPCCVYAGQFIHQKAKYVRSSDTMKTSPIHNNNNNNNDDNGNDDTAVKLVTRLTFSGPHVSHRTVRAVLARRRDMAANQHRACWHVTGRNGAGLIRGRLDDYVVPHLAVERSSFSLTSRRNYSSANL